MHQSQKPFSLLPRHRLSTSWPPGRQAGPQLVSARASGKRDKQHLLTGLLCDLRSIWVSVWPHGWALPADPPWHAAQARGHHRRRVPQWTYSGQIGFRFVGRGRISMRQNITHLRKQTAPFHQRETGYSFSPHSSSTNPVLQSHSNICSHSKL